MARRARGGWLAFALAGVAASLQACAAPDASPAVDATTSDDASDEACVPTTHTISDSVAVFGCAAQIDAVLADLPGPQGGGHNSLATPTVEPLEAAGGRRLKDCRWSSFIDTANTMLAMCTGERHVVSGGCFSQARMLHSAPFESQTIGNLPEQGERYQDVGPTSGWLCTYDGPLQSAGQQAAALCCD